MNSITVLNENNSDNEVAFFTRQEDGESGMTVTALGKFCGVDKSVVSELLSKIRDSDPLGNKLAECLKAFVGKEQRVFVKDSKNSLYVKDELCHAILEYYTFEAREYKGKEIAVQNYKTFAKAGVRVYIWSQTGYTIKQAETLKPDSEILKFYKMSEKISRQLGDRNGLAITRNQINEYLSQFTIPSEHPKSLKQSQKPEIKIDPVRRKIFEDLKAKAVDGKLSCKILRNKTILRRKDVKKLYVRSNSSCTSLRKAETIKMLLDAAKHGYGIFENETLILN